MRISSRIVGNRRDSSYSCRNCNYADRKIVNMWSRKSALLPDATWLTRRYTQMGAWAVPVAQSLLLRSQRLILIFIIFASTLDSITNQNKRRHKHVLFHLSKIHNFLISNYFGKNYNKNWTTISGCCRRLYTSKTMSQTFAAISLVLASDLIFLHSNSAFSAKGERSRLSLWKRSRYLSCFHQKL